jgi:hypothetical protein
VSTSTRKAARLRGLLDSDCAFGAGLYRQIARAAVTRLRGTRVQLAAAWA